MTSSENAGDIFDELSAEHLSQLKQFVMKLYNFELENAKEVYTQLLLDIEVDLGKESIIVEKITWKMSLDLKNYASYEDSAWFMKRRLESFGENHFGTLAMCVGISRFTEDFKDVHDTLLEVARYDGNLIKLLFATVSMAVYLTKVEEMKKARSMIPEILSLLERVEAESSAHERSDHDNHIFCMAFCDLGFLFRDFGDEKKRVSFFRDSLELNETVGKDLGLSIYIETFLVRALANQRPFQEELERRRNHLLENVQRALEKKTYFTTVHRIKIFREAFIEASKICNVRKGSNETVIEVGKLVYDSLKDHFGEKHHEVVFTASQLACHFYTFKEYDQSELYFKLATDGFEHIEEGAKILLHTKSRTAINLRTVLHERKRWKDAEKYCREEIRLNEMQFGKSHQYVCQGFRKLAYVVRNQGRKPEGLGHLKHALKMSMECSSTFLKFHEKLREDIRQF